MIFLNKPRGITPLQAIERYKKRNPEYEHRVLSYAGRLDPMAQGLLMVLVDDENKMRREYEKLNKTYEFEVLLGFETDSYDLLGLASARAVPSVSVKDLQSFVRSRTGTITQHYPPYSAVKVGGKPLYWWMRYGGGVDIPTRTSEIFSFVLLSLDSITRDEVSSEVDVVVGAVQGDFRQKEIVDRWHEILRLDTRTEYARASFRISCSSGTYVRSLAHELGKHLSTGALAYSITRTQIGDTTLDQALAV